MSDTRDDIALVRVFRGRLFCRRNAQRHLSVVGVVEVPNFVGTESVHAARLGDRLRLGR